MTTETHTPLLPAARASDIAAPDAHCRARRRHEHLAAPAVYSSDEARAVAEAALDQRARRFVRAEGVAEGNAQLRVGTCVTLAGVSPQFDNTYYVVRACHLFDMKQGYRTEFSAECAYLGT